MASPFTPSTIPSGGASPLTTKGDLYTYTNADARLAVGSNGQVLTAASGQSTGLQWAASSGVGGMTLLDDQLLAGAAASISVTIPSGYKNIRVSVVARSAAAADTDVIVVRFNGDNAANYYSQYNYATAGVPAAGEVHAQTAGYFGVCTAANDAAALFGVGDVQINNYLGTTAAKTTLGNWLYAQNLTGSTAIWCIGTVWNSTAAVTSMVLTMLTGANFAIGSRVTTYGLS